MKGINEKLSRVVRKLGRDQKTVLWYFRGHSGRNTVPGAREVNLVANSGEGRKKIEPLSLYVAQSRFGHCWAF